MEYYKKIDILIILIKYLRVITRKWKKLKEESING